LERRYGGAIVNERDRERHPQADNTKGGQGLNEHSPDSKHFKSKVQCSKKKRIAMIKIDCDPANQAEAAFFAAWRAKLEWEECLCGTCGLVPVWVRKCASSTEDAVENLILNQLNKMEEEKK